MPDKEIYAYAAMISIQARQALQYYADVRSRKDLEAQNFKYIIDITPEQFRSGYVKIEDEKGVKHPRSIVDIISTCITAIAGCDEALGEIFREQIDHLTFIIMKEREVGEIEDEKLHLRETWNAAKMNDQKIDTDNLRKIENIYFDFIDLLKVKNVGDENMDELYRDSIDALQAERSKVLAVNASKKQGTSPEAENVNKKKKGRK